MKRSAAAIAVIVALCIMPASAFANSGSTSQQYGSGVQSVQNTRTTGTTPSTQAASPSAVDAANATRSAGSATGSLPFTGLDIGGLAAGAVVLLGAGLMLRRVSARKQ